jgi:hypothetical protein
MVAGKGIFSSTACLLLLASALPGRAMAAPVVHLLLKKGTPVELRLAKTISSTNAHPGQPVDFVVVHDLQVHGFTVIRRGSTAVGSVIRVRKDHPLGMPGDVTLQLDSVELADGRRIRLSARERFKGKSHVLRMSIKMVLTAAVYWPLAPLFLLSHGRERTVLAGTKVTAYTVEPVSIPTWNLCPSTDGGLTLPQVIQMLPSRVTNYSGRPGDALDLVFWGTRAEVQAAFTSAGWIVPDRPTPRIIWPLIWHRWHYKKLPMFNLYVYGRPEDLAYVLPNPRLIVERRHHVRIWKTDYELDGIPLWVGSATHDVSIEIVLRKLSIFHRINPNVDKERNFIGRDLAKHWHPVQEEYLDAANPVYFAKTATGQSYHTDGRILFVDLNRHEPLLVLARTRPPASSADCGAPRMDTAQVNVGGQERPSAFSRNHPPS